LPAGAVLARQPVEWRRRFTVAGGDDYELCFAARREDREAVIAAGVSSGTPVTRVGTIDAAAGLRFVDASGAAVDLQVKGWDHFGGS